MVRNMNSIKPPAQFTWQDVCGVGHDAMDDTHHEFAMPQHRRSVTA